MAYFFNNQNNYASVPYPSSNYPNATVKSGGCGVCAACNALNNLFDKIIYTVPQMASFSLQNGGRAANGTDMDLLIKKLHDKLGTFTYTRHYQSGLGNALIKHLKAGGTAILSTTGGTCAPAGLFSTGGHLYAAVGCSGDKVFILDSGYYSGKYDIMNRQRYVTVKGTEPYLVVDKKYVELASQLGGWFLSKKEPSVKAYMYCNTTAGLRFRKGASTSAALVDGANGGKSIIGYGDKVEVLIKAINWCKIRYRGITGFCAVKYLSEKAPKVKKITIPKKYNLRVGASLSSKIAKTTASSVKAELLVNGYWEKDGYSWSRVKLDGKTYYIAKTF